MKLVLVFLSFSLMALGAAPRSLDDSKPLQKVVGDLAENYSEGNGSYNLTENPAHLSPTHLRQCAPSSIDKAGAWLDKQLRDSNLFQEREIRAAVRDFASLLGRHGEIERCFSKERIPGDPDHKTENLTSYHNKKTEYRLLFSIVPTNV